MFPYVVVAKIITPREAPQFQLHSDRRTDGANVRET